jgi:hypothetical protein
MKRHDRLEDIIRKDLDVCAKDRTYDRLRNIVLAAHETSRPLEPAATLVIPRRTIMRNPITKLVAAAAVIAVISLGIFEFVGTGSRSGVAWAEVAQKVGASRGVIYRERRGADNDYSITYLSPTRHRSEAFLKGQPWMTMYDDRGTGKRVVLLHAQKGYVLEDMTLTAEGNRKHANFQDPTWWVQKFLTCAYTKLEPREIDGTPCEGIETTDTALVADHDSQVSSLVARLWVSVETGYPVLFEGEFHGQQSGNVVFDQFQWDAELDPGLFEPKIPADYQQM